MSEFGTYDISSITGFSSIQELYDYGAKAQNYELYGWAERAYFDFQLADKKGDTAGMSIHACNMMLAFAMIDHADRDVSEWVHDPEEAKKYTQSPSYEELSEEVCRLKTILANAKTQTEVQS